MKSGLDLIREKREGHFYNDHRPLEDIRYTDGSLLKVAMSLIKGDQNIWPNNWPQELMDKFVKMPIEECLAEAGAFIAAEIDRLKFSENVLYYTGINIDVSYSGLVDSIQEDKEQAKALILALISVYFHAIKEKELSESLIRSNNYDFTHVRQGLYHICRHMNFTLPLMINDGNEYFEIDTDFNIEKKENVL